MTDSDDFTLRRFRQILAQALDEARPDRYVVSDSTLEDDEVLEEERDGIGWIDDVSDAHAHLLPAEDVQKLYARDLGHDIESNTNLRRGNAAIRAFAGAEQPDLGWLDRANYPVTVVHRIAREGERPRILRERVRVASMTATDLRLWAAEERKEAAREFATRNRTCVAAESIADAMDEGRYRLVGDWIEGQVEDTGTDADRAS